MPNLKKKHSQVLTPNQYTFSTLNLDQQYFSLVNSHEHWWHNIGGPSINVKNLHQRVGSGECAVPAEVIHIDHVLALKSIKG